MSKRLEALEKMIAAGQGDLSFARYARALELKGLGRLQESHDEFEELQKADPGYVAQYLMAGGVAEALGRKDDARRWYEEGVIRAWAKGDAHTLGEIQTALSLLS